MAWDDLLGHDLAKQVFQAHLASGCVPNAYLLSGPEGVGKRRLALEMAKALNCTGSSSRSPGQPSAFARAGCNQCLSCTQINRQVHPDVHLLLPGGASEQIKIEDIRRLLGRIALRPFSAHYQVALLDGAERLTEESANSLLKALEEPTAHTRFLLTTAHLSDCLPTIISRCQLIRCNPLPLDAVAQIVRRATNCTPETARTLAHLSGGSASQALALGGQWAQHQQLLSRFANDRLAAWIEQPQPETRQELLGLLDTMMRWLRDLAVTAAGGSHWVVYSDQMVLLRRQADGVNLERCIETALELIELRESVERFVSPRLIAALAREKWLSLQRAERTISFDF